LIFMRHTRRLLLLFVLLLPPTAVYAQTPAFARVETVKFESKLIGQQLPYHVVLPPDYWNAQSHDVHYPVLYLLHGLGGSHHDWLSQRAHLAAHAARHRIIIVTPEGRDSWYTDSGTVPQEKFESYFMQELLPDVARRFRTLERREGRAVAGLSMGGYGALKFGVKYPAAFAVAASMSGALSAPQWDAQDKGLLEFVRPSVARVYGAMNNPVRPANDLFKLLSELPQERIAALPFIYLDCGTEDFLIESNRALAALLLKRRIPHEYRQLPGGHTWPYWDRQVQEILRLAAERLAAPEPLSFAPPTQPAARP
jgi:putative tributyrin esterase